MEHFLLTFPFNYQNVYGHQTFQDGNMLQGTAWHLNGVVLWFTWHIKCISPPAEDVLSPPH